MQKIGEKSLFILAINRSAPHFRPASVATNQTKNCSETL